MLYLIKYIRGWLASKRKIHEGILKKICSNNLLCAIYRGGITFCYPHLLYQSFSEVSKFQKVAMDLIPKLEDSELTNKIKDDKKWIL